MDSCGTNRKPYQGRPPSTLISHLGAIPSQTPPSVSKVAHSAPPVRPRKVQHAQLASYSSMSIRTLGRMGKVSSELSLDCDQRNLPKTSSDEVLDKRRNISAGLQRPRGKQRCKIDRKSYSNGQRFSFCARAIRNYFVSTNYRYGRA